MEAAATAASPPIARPNPACPRCGYDLTGAVATWSSSCPLEIVCSECGLAIDCRDVLSPVYAIEPRFFEHAVARRPRAIAVTSLMACRPRAFWTWVRMAHEVRARRAALGALLGVALIYGLAVALAAALSIAMALALWLLDGYVRSSQVRGNFSAAMAAELAILSTWPMGDLDDALRPRAWWRQDEWLVHPALGVGLLAGLVMPLSFLLLPATLQQARVRRVHLARIWAYSWIGVVPLLIAAGPVDLAVRSLAYRYAAAYRPLMIWDRFGHAICLGAVLLWVLAWWSAASGRYLRLRHPVGVAAAMLCISGLLATLAGLALLGPHLVDDLGLR